VQRLIGVATASMTAPVAVTGASGFVGRAVVRRLVEAGRSVRVLTRRPDPDLERIGLETVQGSLENESALCRLVAGAGAVVHCAGVIAAPRAAIFSQVNALGATRLFAAAASAATRPRILLLSSLAAREPGLSAYAHSKRAGEEALWRTARGNIEGCVLRPPAVYGPGDRATLPIFRQLRSGLLLVPAAKNARFSLLYVQDLANAVEHLLGAPDWGASVLELDDGYPGGYCWADLAEIAGRQLGRRVRTIAVPRAVLWPVAAVDGLAGAALRRAPRVSLGKLRELLHADWLVRPSAGPPLQGWSPRTTFAEGFEETLAWYRQRGWL
jgi:nucleoside-diphosphate-sugar epimerase